MKPLNFDKKTQTFTTDVALAAFRLDVDAENEYRIRRAQGSLHREVLVSEGKTVVAPSAIAARGADAGGVYERWVPNHDCGTVASDAVSGDCGTAAIECIWLDCGGA